MDVLLSDLLSQMVDRVRTCSQGSDCEMGLSSKIRCGERDLMGTEQSGETRDETRETSLKGYKVDGDSTSASAGETSRQGREHTRKKRGNTR